MSSDEEESNSYKRYKLLDRLHFELGVPRINQKVYVYLEGPPLNLLAGILVAYDGHRNMVLRDAIEYNSVTRREVVMGETDIDGSEVLAVLVNVV